MILVSSNFCWLQLDRLFVVTVLWESPSDIDARNRALTIVQTASTVWTIFLLMMITALNICLCLDLVLMLRRPFSSHTSRTKWYLLVSLLAALLTTLGYYFEVLAGKGKR